MAWYAATVSDLPTLDAITKPWAREDPDAKELLGTVRMHAFRGSVVRVVYEASGLDPLHIHIGHLSKQRRGAWGVYYNWLLAYTPPPLRRVGLARWAFNDQVHFHLGLDVDRIKSLAGSKYGVLLHYGMGHQFWGATDKGELVVDTPAHDNVRFPLAVPFHARTLPKWKGLAEADGEDMKGVRPMNPAEVKAFYKDRYRERFPTAKRGSRGNAT